MSAPAFGLTSTTQGLEGFGEELLRGTLKVAKSALSKAATPFARQMRNNLSKRGGPARPGDPPARLEGALRDTVGKDRPRASADGLEVAVGIGIGVGKAKAAKVAEWKGKGINVFEYAVLHERGGIGADGRRYPPRPYARTAEAQVEAEVDAILQELLS